MAEAFSSLMRQMFAGFDLLLTSSAHPLVKSLTAPVILRELERSREHEAAVRAQTNRLIAAGYHEQVTVRPDAANVLFEDKEGRDRLVREDGHWHLARTKRRLDTQEIHELLTLRPESFSPNVLLRPVVASAVFPTIAYVGGPAEVSYFGQIGCLFQAHEVVMPLVEPRVSIEIVEHKVQKVLDKFSLERDTVKQPFDQLASQVVRDELPEEVSATVARLRDEIAARYAELVAATQSIDPTLRGPLESTRNASHKALADAEKKIVSHLKKKNEIGIEQLRKASNNLLPDGQPQERVINALSYIARYGPAFLEAVASQIGVDLSANTPEWTGVKCE
jgi:bacillithiol biosynthesis cysteine-adding enzyme BshC